MKKTIARCFLLLSSAIIIVFLLSIPFLPIFKKHHAKELNVFVWGAFLSPDVISEFEHKYKTKINIQVSSNNEELLSKVKNAKPDEFDIIFASDYAIKVLRNNNFLKELDKSQLDFLDRISPILNNHTFDPGNKYSIPYSWEVFGIAENTKMITPAETPSLSQIFKKNKDNRTVAMIPEPVEAFSIAAYYLFKKSDNLTQDEIRQTKELLRKQKKWVEAYADYRSKYLIATENCPIGLVKSSFYPDIVTENPEVLYRLPVEGTFLSIEHIAIPKASKNEKSAYQFINHISKKESIHESLKFCAMFPACFDAVENSLLDTPEIHALLDEILERKDLVFYDFHMKPSELRESWISIKN